jgi:hypothetical protein
VRFETLHGKLFRFLLALIVAGCGISGDSQSKNPSTGVQAAAWGIPTTVDIGVKEATAPLLAIEPDDGISAVAVWIEESDLNPFDNIPPISHLYAKRFAFGFWALTDAGCPPNSGGNDGICRIDTGSDEFSSSNPRIAMDDNGDAIVVWQQSDGSDCFTTAPDVEVCNRIYARTLKGGVWSDPPVIISSSAADAPAADPDISLERDGGGTAIAVFGQWNGTVWTIQANRCVDDAAGADAGTACGDTAGEWGQTGSVAIDGGTFAARSPRLGMDDSGNAIATFIRERDDTCTNPPLGNNLNNTSSLTCKNDQLWSNRFSIGTVSWQGQTNINLGQPPGTTNNLCFQGTNTITCFSIRDTDLSVSRNGNALVVGKEFWGEAEDLGVQNNFHNGWFLTGRADDEFNGNAIGTRYYNGTAWAATQWLYSHINNLGSLTRCSSTSVQDENDRVLLNCNLYAPKVTIEPVGGGSGVAIYERYNGANERYDIQAHRFDGTNWSAANVGELVETSTLEAHAPQVDMDSSGNTIAVWVQLDGSSQWRVYTRTRTTTAWAATDAASGCTTGGLNGADDGVCNLDGDIGTEDAYFNPIISVNQAGGALSLFTGWSLNGFNDSLTKLYSVSGP